MQQERLEGWMVQQIEHANLAKETLLQLPTRPARSPAAPPASSTANGREWSPRRRPAPVSARAAESSPLSGPTERRATTAPLQTPRQRHLRLFGARGPVPTSTFSTAAEHSEAVGGDRAVDKQWRSQFSSRAGLFVEGDRVDRTKALRGHGGAGRSDGVDYSDAAAADAPSSPMLLWGLPREQILDFIHQSLLPSSWIEYAPLASKRLAMLPLTLPCAVCCSPRNAGEWGPAPPASWYDDDDDAKPMTAHAYVSFTCSLG